MAVQILLDVCKEVCDEMWPEVSGRMSIGVVHVWCLRDGKTETCDLPRVGNYRRSPSAKVVMEVADRILGYSIVEEPDWFPMYGMF